MPTTRQQYSNATARQGMLLNYFSEVVTRKVHFHFLEKSDFVSHLQQQHCARVCARPPFSPGQVHLLHTPPSQVAECTPQAQ